MCQSRVELTFVTDTTAFEDIGDEIRETGWKEADDSFKPHRVFINHVDSYHGKRLVDFLSQQIHVEAETENSTPETARGEEVANEQGSYGSAKKGGIEGEMSVPKLGKKYEIIGTAINPKYPLPETVLTLIKNESDRSVFLQEIMECGIIIYDITQDSNQINEVLWSIDAINEEVEKEEHTEGAERKRRFILISTIMTWALTRPLILESEILPFNESDYKRRKAHPNFEAHFHCENKVLEANEAVKLKTLVLCCGVTYGFEENGLHYLFKMAWQNSPFLPIFGNGSNKIPLLHVQDLSTIVHNSLQNWPAINYIVAVERQLETQRTIVQEISRILNTGVVKNIEKEAEAFLFPGVEQHVFDNVNVDLSIEPVAILQPDVKWQYDMMPFQENIEAIVREYIQARNLFRMKLILFAPNDSREILGRLIADYYGIHYVKVNEDKQITYSLNVAGELSGHSTNFHINLGIDNDYRDKEKKGSFTTEIRDNVLVANNERLIDNVLSKRVKNCLESKPFKNQGYVLEGYPVTLKETEVFFQAESTEKQGKMVECEMEERNIEQEDALMQSENLKILPDLLVLVEETNDEFLKERVMMSCPGKEIQHDHYSTENMIRPLQESRSGNSVGKSATEFIRDLQDPPVRILIKKQHNVFSTFDEIIKRLGDFVGTKYDSLRVEMMGDARKRRADVENLAAREVEENDERKKREYVENMREWEDAFEKLKNDEEKRLLALGLPLREYLIKHIFPTLTRGLLEVSRVRPDDPLDFLAEYLFGENPDGKMLDIEDEEEPSVQSFQAKSY